MTMAATMAGRTAEARVRSKARRLASVQVLTDLETAQPAWRELEDTAHFSTPYQRYDLLRAWQQSVGTPQGELPLIAIGYDAERRPLLLLPLSAMRRHGVRIGRFMGGKHTTFNMALWDREFAAAAGLSDLNVLLAALREHANLDMLSLTQQPLHWRGRQNPFALLPHQPSINRCPLLLMTPGGTPASRVSNSFRRRLKGKERKLQALPGFRYHVATSDDEIKSLLDWFFRVKPLRMAAQKLPNVFSEPGVEDFIRAACLAPRGDGRVIEMHALECDQEVIAMFAGVTDGYRFSMMFNSYTMSEHARYSPGLILLRSIIDRYGERGFGALDLGMGADDYKRLFCKSDEVTFDSFIPLSARGRIVAPPVSAVNRCKRLVKENERLFALARRLRSALH